MIPQTKLTTSENLDISTSKWFKVFVIAFSATMFDRSRTAPRLRKYAAGSRFGSGGFGISTFGENGVRGVVGMLAPVADALLKERPFELMGDLSVSWSDWKLVVEFESPGNSLPTTLGAFGFLEKRPIAIMHPGN
jgi:hypothetical protein